MEGQDGNGLQREKIGPLLFKFSLMSNKNHYKLFMFCFPFKNSLHVFILEFSDHFYV